MTVSWGLIPFVFIFSCLIFVILIQNRLHNNTKHKSLHTILRSSLSPSCAPKAAFSAAAAASPAYTTANSSTSTTSTSSKSGIYNVLSFRAVGDGVADDTDAFKLAWDTACQCDSSPTVLVPIGHSFLIQSTIFTGPCKSSLILQIDGNMKPPDGPNSWPKNKSKRQWLVFYRINGMSMQGDGLIDGRGEKWWNLPCKPHKGPKGRTLPGPCDSPAAIRFFMSSNLTVKGIKINNSPQFHIRFDNCHNVHIDSLTIKSPSSSPNTDGIHIENTNDVKIYNSIISNGDDCLSIGDGCYNVDIRNVTCGPSHGISIGSLGGRNSRACVSNITVTNSVITSSDNGVRIKTWQGGSGQVRNVMFNNIKMETVRNPIVIDQYYCQTKKCANQTSAVFISDITYISIKGTYDVRSPPMHLACSESIPCTNITLSDIELLPSQGKFLANPVCWNAYGDLKTPAIPPVLSCLLAGIPESLPENLAGRC